jgi:alkanesulfonate monooxygenase SsuD/methylene tetrahydromethanopterin reductase-like flavin-dependent oxidoreductase (luciferase family)
MPGRISLPTFRKRVARLSELATEAGKPMLTTAAIPITSPGRTREEALSKVDWRGMVEQAIEQRWELPASGNWESADDLEGALIAGPPDAIVADVRKYHDAGLDHLVFDLRLRFADWFDCLTLLGEEVLPQLRGTQTTPARTQASSH